MKEKSRYDTSGLIESQVEPSSGGRVLKNLLGIKRKREMDQIEGREQRRALDELIRIYEKDHRFTATDIRPAPGSGLLSWCLLKLSFLVPPGRGDKATRG